MSSSKDPLHGKTLQMILEYLVEKYGWEELGLRIPVKCFTNHPTVSSSLTFLRKTGWARLRVENLYLATVEGILSKDGPPPELDLGL